MSQNVPLAPVQELAALALAKGSTLQDVASEVGVNRKTIARWKRQERFNRRTAELRGELLTAGLGRLVDASCSAADTLKKLLTSQSEPVQHSAARSILMLANDLRKTAELEAEIEAIKCQITELEAAQAGEKNGRFHER
jgi:transcriptional regulator with XRE-family HTH domain